MKSDTMRARCAIMAVFFALGALTGHLIVHPYAMVSYSLMDMMRHGSMTMDMGHVMQSAGSIFEPFMLPMTIAFSLLCGLIALLMAMLYDKKRRLHDGALENERKKASLETLHRLMVTLSHYLLNANTVIGGMIRHCRKHDSKEEVVSSLAVMEEQAHKIDAVIAALRKVTEIRTADYTSEGHGLMIDVEKEILELMKEKNAIVG
ncbi:hypothetical protein NBG4_460014 [Candidatus Sulfobium mesophilum]|uniref:Signal transduction histidine kinase dimerisation/phosphoacceptor domain-containing protein n=1 Tax=Candidatus Sulfobium mesophilum TaxID=2016548 RepID=A0A2U3QIE5_9BACT|nr:hypothetical protein NBG4_460014 [Candidatus Sulfobium mesophilum]